jgi:hypothetical protein
MKNKVGVLLFTVILLSCEERYEYNHPITEGEFFTARVGDFYYTETNSFMITAVEDNRCPINAACIVAGNVTVYFSIFNPTQIHTTINLFSPSGNPIIFIDPFNYELHSVDPAPSTYKRIKQSAYRIKMKVYRDSM